MASGDDDDAFALLGDDHHQSAAGPDRHLPRQPYAPQHFSTAVTPVQSESHGDTGENYVGTFDNDVDGNEKGKDREEAPEGMTLYGCKRPKPSSSGTAEYKRDREEWSDTAIVCLLEAYTEKFNQLNRGNLRGRDWEEVAAIVSERCENQTKSVEQCKHKVDNLKKRYKLERHRMSNGCISINHWPWFNHMEQIVGYSLPGKLVPDEDKGEGSAGSSARQSKRYGAAMPSNGGQVNSVKTKTLSNLRWRRVVLKISGATLNGSGTCYIDPKVAMLVSREVVIASRLGVELAIVVGGCNFFCGDAWVTATGLERYATYQVGMMATVMNSILLHSTLEKMGVQTRVQTSIAMQEFAEPHNRQRAIRHLEKGRVVIFGGIDFGTGNLVFSTDIAAAVRASEINAEAVLKGTNVDGVYDCNSRDNSFTFEHMSFRELVSKRCHLYGLVCTDILRGKFYSCSGF